MPWSTIIVECLCSTLPVPIAVGIVLGRNVLAEIQGGGTETNPDLLDEMGRLPFKSTCHINVASGDAPEELGREGPDDELRKGVGGDGGGVVRKGRFGANGCNAAKTAPLVSPPAQPHPWRLVVHPPNTLTPSCDFRQICALREEPAAFGKLVLEDRMAVPVRGSGINTSLVRTPYICPASGPFGDLKSHFSGQTCGPFWGLKPPDFWVVKGVDSSGLVGHHLLASLPRSRTSWLHALLPVQDDSVFTTYVVWAVHIGAYSVTSLNIRSIPFMPTGTVSLQIREDGHYREHDFTVCPQVFSDVHVHRILVRNRGSPYNSHLDCMWWTPTAGDFDPLPNSA
ncbi:hypothetical protein FIBSPDRAFT_884990 [Athelia psychrophila]|uniref:Uncharacterized protein n=1 Tax=Athelia psychrophila TaxID=1759441 RepID=A0A166S9X3_9AGAM|nr:hypothetical protein FIBSPDRAFT_884990 [Fibularhizoctonia sp. CBS 109695]